MKILSVNANSNITKSYKQNYSKNTNSTNPINNTTLNLNYLPNSLAFLGYNVHIFDGGPHADNMQHFANSISPDMDTKVYAVETNPISPYDKQMKSLLEELQKFPPKNDKKDEYIALPGLCTVPLQNIEDQYERVIGTRESFTPENVKSKKPKLLQFLKKVSENPKKYKEYLGYMDPNGQGIEYVYPVIQEINRLTDEGYKVYVSAGHPECQSLKWMSGEKGKKAELQHYIATGVDVNNEVAKMRKEIQDNGWYTFNLLNLSDAHIVNVKDAGGKEDYIYAAYDSTITDGARGVFNFYPVRDAKGNVRGYSYSGRSSVDYPYEEFPQEEAIEHLLKFVGKDYTEVVASKNEANEFKKLHEESKSKAKEKYSDVLFDVNDVFTPDEIKKEKIGLKGRYVDSSLKLFFDKNDKTGEVTFPNCNCEGSERPSVVSMWGSCFAVFSAIKNDIELVEKKEQDTAENSFGKTPEVRVKELLLKGDTAGQSVLRREEAEAYYNNAAELCKMHGIKNPNPHIALGNLHLKAGKLNIASECYNNAINTISENLNEKYLSKDKENSLNKIKLGKETYEKALKQEESYRIAKKQYENSGFLHRLFNNAPTAPTLSSSNYKKYAELYKEVQTLSELFGKMAEVCNKKGESYPAKVCAAASKEIKECTTRGTKVVAARADGIQYIGNIFNEINAD